MVTKQSNIIFAEGKEKLLQKIFDSSNFGYLAVGYNQNTGDTNGFINVDPDQESQDNGFYEITEDSTYKRVPLSFHSILNKDDNGKVTAKFTAELDLDNIINNMPINQIAIVDSSEKTNASTTFFAAAVTETFVKSEKLALVFVIEITI